MVRKRKKILSRFLLAIYLLVILHHSASLLHDAGHCSYADVHDGFEEHHHDHRFHIGVFHFLGHLLENISHYDYLESRYLSLSQEPLGYQKMANFSSTNFCVREQDMGLNFILYNSICNNGFTNFLIHKSNKLDNPLRAPPIC